ncbi:MAG: DUF6683 family protein [Rubrivivax sp.]
MLVAGLCGSALAAAQAGFYPAWGLNGAPQAQMLTSSVLMQRVVNHRLGSRSSGLGSNVAAPAVKPATATAAGPLTFSPGPRPIAPARLASGYALDVRTEAEATFDRMLDAYHQIERQFDLPRNDLGGALAAFVAGNVMAYHDRPFPDRLFKPLVQQMRAAIGVTGAFDDTAPAEKQELYESLAILGMFMAATREAVRTQSDPTLAAKVRTAARGTLQRTLRLDPDRVQLTERGLTVD